MPRPYLQLQEAASYKISAFKSRSYHSPVPRKSYNLMQRDKKDHFLTGFIIAIISPIVFYGILLTLLDMLDSAAILTHDQLAADFGTRTLSLVAIGCNAFFMNYFNKKRWINAMRGMIIPTLAMAGYWFYMHYDKLF